MDFRHSFRTLTVSTLDMDQKKMKTVSLKNYFFK